MARIEKKINFYRMQYSVTLTYLLDCQKSFLLSKNKD